MKTASYFTSRAHGRISVSLGSPKWLTLPTYAPLHPKGWMLQLQLPEYERAYRAQLAKLDPRQVVADLERLAGDHEPVLCCWEKPPFDEINFCHRRMVAEWLNERIGLRVDEVDPPAHAPTPQLALFGGAK